MNTPLDRPPHPSSGYPAHPPAGGGSGRDRILVVLASRESLGSPAGGIHKAVLAQIAALRTQKLQVTLVTASESCAESAARMGIETDVSPIWHNSIKPLLLPRFWWKLLKLRARGDVRCVIHHSGRTWLWGHLFFVGIPQVQVFHRELIRPYRFFVRWLALSPGYAAHLAAKHSLGGLRKVAWAPNSLPAPPPPPPPPRLPRDRFIVGFLGRSGADKGVDSLLEAMALLKASDLPFELRFGGDGEAYVRTLAAEHGVAEHVVFTGWHTDPASFLDELDLLVLPSVKESFGLVLIEAMARGKAVLATDCHGPASIVLDGETGYLTPVGDSAALASKLRAAMENPHLSRMGEAGFRRVNENFIPETAGRRLVIALRELGTRLPEPRPAATKDAGAP